MSIRRGIIGLAILVGSVGALALAPSAAPKTSADSYNIDPVHSSAVFRVKHVNVSYFYGRFNEVTGTIKFDEGDPSGSTVEVSIKADSVDTHNSKRDNHLKSQDFFNVAKFPTLTFKSKSFAKAGENTFDVSGDLTIHGETKAVTVKLEKTGGGKGKIGFETMFTLKRSDYGMNFMQTPDGLGDEVRVMLALEAGK